MLFSYSLSLRDEFPELSTGVLHVQGICPIDHRSIVSLTKAIRQLSPVASARKSTS